MRKALLAALLILLPATAQAAEEKKKDDKPKAELNMSPIGLPVISQGQVVNYVFVGLKLVLDPRQDPVKLHAKEPYLRDQLVRQGSHTPFNPPNDMNHFDDGRFKAAVMADAKAVFGPGVVKSVEISSETAQHFVRPPALEKPAPKPVEDEL